jgi:hypothetical protein
LPCQSTLKPSLPEPLHFHEREGTVMTPHHDGAVKERSVERWASSQPEEGSARGKRREKVSFERKEKEKDGEGRLTPPGNLVANADEGAWELEGRRNGSTSGGRPADGAGEGEKVRLAKRGRKDQKRRRRTSRTRAIRQGNRKEERSRANQRSIRPFRCRSRSRSAKEQ